MLQMSSSGTSKVLAWQAGPDSDAQNTPFTTRALALARVSGSPKQGLVILGTIAYISPNIFAYYRPKVVRFPAAQTVLDLVRQGEIIFPLHNTSFSRE